MNTSVLPIDVDALLAAAQKGDAAVPAYSVGDALYRYAHGQLQAADVLLSVGGAQRHLAVHETRKAIRRCRAMLALAANGSNDAAYPALDRRLSRLARSLSLLRDAEVAVLGAKAEMDSSVDVAERRE